MSLSLSDINALQHALGISGGRENQGEPKPTYRNYYAADPGDTQMEYLVSLGLMRRGRTIPGGLMYYHVTECGKVLAWQELPKATKRTRSQKRYERFLDMKDVFPDMTFREFLKEYA